MKFKFSVPPSTHSHKKGFTSLTIIFARSYPYSYHERLVKKWALEKGFEIMKKIKVGSDRVF
jgi:hypothetical protein